MHVRHALHRCAVLLALASPACEDAGTGDEADEGHTDDALPGERGVEVNGRTLDGDELAQLEQLLYADVPAGKYWYDARSGLGGPWGSYARVYAPGLDLGPVPADASNGDTDIFYNGRELSYPEAQLVAWLFGIAEQDIPLFVGRYVLESTGDIFTEDGVWLGNLAVLATQMGGGAPGGGDDCTAVTIPSSAANPTGVPQTIDVATGSGC